MAWAAQHHLQGLAELGVAGCVPLPYLLAAVPPERQDPKTLSLSRCGKDSPIRIPVGVGADLALVAYLVSGAFLTVLYYPHLWFIVGLSASYIP
jgi:hypothetical protein